MKTPPPNTQPPSKLRLGIAISIALCSLMLLLGVGFWTWLLRDGLGPDSVESSGGEALQRFFADFWPVGLLCLGLFPLAFFIARPRAVPSLRIKR